MYAVTDDNKEISHPNYTRAVFNRGWGGVWTEFLMMTIGTETINSFVILYTVPKNRHASAFIVTLAAYGTSVSAFLIGQMESFPAFYFRITNQITLSLLSVVKMRQNIGY